MGKEIFTAYTLFGEECCDQWDNHEKIDLKCGSVVKRDFATEAERDAYYMGMEDCYGWMTYTDIDKDCYEQIRKDNPDFFNDTEI